MKGRRRFRVESSRGFSLLEVLIAMSILGIGIVTCLAAFRTGIRLDERSGDLQRALEVHREVQLGLGRTGGAIEASEGETEDGFQWRVEILPLDWQAEPAPEGLQRARVSITWERKGRGQSIQFEELLCQGMR